VVQVPGEVKEMMGDEVAGILRQLVLREALSQPVDGVGRNHQEKNSADQLEESVESVLDQSDVEGGVQHVPSGGLDAA
jgi:hypothetical protein